MLDYDPKTGTFTWRVSRRGRFAHVGAVAGAKTKKGYRQICIDGTLYSAGSLAAFWMTGRWPVDQINYANGNGDDLRWTNLRPANHSQCGGTARARSPKKVDAPKGVVWDKNRAKFVARIKVNYRTINLGRFDSIEGAHAAYATAACKYFGEFA
jgi:hypothetical protein